MITPWRSPSRFIGTMSEPKHYHFLAALRFFSLSVALISCGLGIRLGWDESAPQYTIAILVVTGGLLAQAGVNLINDVEDLHQATALSVSNANKKQILKNQKLGWFAFGIAALISLVLIYLRGWPLLAVIVLSAFFALSYNSGPLNFKHRGLAMVQVFMLMGLVMIQASYYVMTGQFSLDVVWISLPVSLLISLLLLSNEIRDYDDEKALGVQTLSVRIGLTQARTLFWALIFATYLSALLVWQWVIPLRFWLLLIPLPMLFSLAYHLKADNRQPLTPLCGRFFMLFGVMYLLAIQA